MRNARHRSIEFGFFFAPLLVVAWTHVSLAPYTKVEESFTIQAVYDLLTFGGWTQKQLQQFDHLTFSGAVPRSFVGPIVLAITSYPWIAVAHCLQWIRSSADVGLIVRLSLTTWHALALWVFAQLVLADDEGSDRHARRINLLARRFLYLIYAVQFHALFWAGRTTPNGVVMPVVIVALGCILNAQQRRTMRFVGVALLTGSAVIARLEIIGLIAPAVVLLLFSSTSSTSVRQQKDKDTIKRTQPSFLQTLGQICAVGLVSGMAALTLAVAVDSYMWKRPLQLTNPLSFNPNEPLGLLWAEWEAIVFNVVQGKSSEWGTSPWHAYLSQFLPKLLSLPALLTVAGVVAIFLTSDRTTTVLRHGLALSAGHVATMSLLDHKEARFVSYTVPVLNAVGAYAAATLWSAGGRRRHQWILNFTRLAILGLLAATSVLTYISLLASWQNYPGGEALRALHVIASEDQAQGTVVHIDVLPSMTGVTLFQSVRNARQKENATEGAFGTTFLPPAVRSTSAQSGWLYDKTEDIDWDNDDRLVETFHYILSDDPRCHRPSLFEPIIDSSKGVFAFGEFDGIRLVRPKEYVNQLKISIKTLDVAGLLPLDIRRRDVVWLCKRRDGTI